jgi:hypothetical protein
MTARKTDLLKTARDIGVPGDVSSMNVATLITAIRDRRAYLATPAADVVVHSAPILRDRRSFGAALEATSLDGEAQQPRRSRRIADLTIDGTKGVTHEQIEKLATNVGTHDLFVATDVSLKVVTDRLRRIPRIKGWNALTVRVGDVKGKRQQLIVTCSTEKAKPWPKPAKT